MSWKQGFNEMLGNPMFHMGLGLLGGGTPIQGMNQGLMSYSGYQGAAAEQQRLEEERQQLLMQQQALQNMGIDPNLPPDVLKEMVKAKYDQTTAMQNLIAAGYQPGTPEFQAAMNKYLFKPSSTVDVTVSPTLDLRPSVQGDLQTQVVAGQEGLSQIDALINDLKAAPEMVGRPARWLETAGSEARAWGTAFGVPFLSAFGNLAAREKEVTDPDGTVRTITPTTIASDSLAVKTSLRPLLAPDKGPLTAQEQSTMKEAFGMLDSSDAKVRLAALNSIARVVRPKMDRIKTYLRVSGAAVPGEQMYPRPKSQAERDKLAPGTTYIDPTGGLRVKQ